MTEDADFPSVFGWICLTCDGPVTVTTKTFDNGVLVEAYHAKGVGLDHPVVPAFGVADASKFICDFCSHPEPAWTYPTVPASFDVSVGEHTYTANDDDGWAACSFCARIIDRRDVAALVERALTHSEQMRQILRNTPQQERRKIKVMMAQQIRAQYEGFFERRVGEKYPLVRVDTSSL